MRLTDARALYRHRRFDPKVAEIAVNTIAKKLAKLGRELRKERGAFDLFALFLREDGKWDLVAGADWLRPDERKSLDFLVKRVGKALTKNELVEIARIYILLPGHPFRFESYGMQSWTELDELSDFKFDGAFFKHGFIFETRWATPPQVRKMRKPFSPSAVG